MINKTYIIFIILIIILILFFIINNKILININEKFQNKTVKVNHNAGFFSCCSVKLDNIIKYINKNKELPQYVNSSSQFEWYKPTNLKNKDITYEYFKKDQKNIIPDCKKKINYKESYQFSIYKNLDINTIYPIVQKYFSLSDKILKIENNIKNKYNLNYENICVLFYRGNDKATEVKLPNYNDYIKWGQKILDLNPNIQFLIQSDETEFIEKMKSNFKNHIVFNDEIRHMSKSNNTVDKIDSSRNFEFSKKYLAITSIMSKCKYVIFGSGNCSIWIVFFRGNANGIVQHYKGKWYNTL